MYKHSIKKVDKNQTAVRNIWINICTTKNFIWYENMSGTIRSRKYFRPVFTKIDFVKKTWSNIDSKRIRKFADFLEEKQK